MSKFKYYIVNFDEGSIEGSNDTELANDCSTNDDYLVINIETDVVIDSTGADVPIEEA